MKIGELGSFSCINISESEVLQDESEKMWHLNPKHQSQGWRNGGREVLAKLRHYTQYENINITCFKARVHSNEHYNFN